MGNTTRPQSQENPGAAAKRQQQAQEDRERARARRLEHTAQRRKLQLAADETTEPVQGQKLPEVHRR